MTRSDGTPADLAIIIVSTNEAKWLDRALSTIFAHAGTATLDVVVVDNESTDGTRELVETRFPQARVVHSTNHGFAHANNRGAMTCDARYILFLNPDTEIVDGTFSDVVAEMDAMPDVGMAGVRQLTGDGELWPTIRYFPSVTRAFGEALGSERWPIPRSWAGERELDLSLYDEARDCDWTSGSFMFCRREALFSAGLMDERFFIYSEEPDLCLRMKRAGWRTRHLPTLTIIHHAGKGGVRPKMVAQDVFTRRQYALKHFSAPRRAAYLTGVGVRLGVRAAVPGGGRGPDRRAAARLALRTLVGREDPPFGTPPAVAVAPPAQQS
jgi:N-acetylglucosaminyl-diphospho-decaprenol L-rhamnosyltransferase